MPAADPMMLCTHCPGSSCLGTMYTPGGHGQVRYLMVCKTWDGTATASGTRSGATAWQVRDAAALLIGAHAAQHIRPLSISAYRRDDLVEDVRGLQELDVGVPAPVALRPGRASRHKTNSHRSFAPG